MNDLYSMISMASNKLRTNKNIISFYKINVRLIILKKKTHHSASILCSDLCHLINVMLFLEVFFFSFNINPIQWQWNPDNHPFHTQIRPITTTSVSICQNNFPSKEFNSYYASSTFSSVSFKISSYLLHATLTPHEIHRNRTDKAPISSNSLGFCVKY